MGATPASTPTIGFCQLPSGPTVAFAEVGEGPPLVMVPGWLSHVEKIWAHPAAIKARDRLAATHRFIWYDRLGCGLSDRDGFFATTNTGKLYRLTPTADPRKRDITEITIDQGPQTGADGLEIDGHTLYLVRNQDDVVVTLTLSEDYATTQVASRTKDPLFRTPTSVALAPEGRLLIGIAEYFNSDGPPYHVVSIRRP